MVGVVVRRRDINLVLTYRISTGHSFESDDLHEDLVNGTKSQICETFNDDIFIFKPSMKRRNIFCCLYNNGL